MPEEIRPDILPLIHFIQSSFAIHFNTSPFLMNTMQLKKKKKPTVIVHDDNSKCFFYEYNLGFDFEWRTMIRQF